MLSDLVMFPFIQKYHHLHTYKQFEEYPYSEKVFLSAAWGVYMTDLWGRDMIKESFKEKEPWKNICELAKD